MLQIKIKIVKKNENILEHGGRLLIFHSYNKDLNLNEEALKEKSHSLNDKINNRVRIDQFKYDIFSNILFYTINDLFWP